MKKITSKGFTIIELLVVIAILGILAAISAASFQNMSRNAALRAGASEVYGALIDAQTKTLGSKEGTVYGVHVSSTTVTRFEGDTYTAGSATNKIYVFEGGVRATSTLFANGGNILFTRLTGTPSMSGTIDIRNMSESGTTTIRIHGTGLIEYE